ncbi:MAG: glycosyl transferase [Cyanobacteria bacterium M5B4]|nr:MAG: glycosyl transferase [Cyanobacteria bacterium M5B4]
MTNYFRKIQKIGREEGLRGIWQRVLTKLGLFLRTGRLGDRPSRVDIAPPPLVTPRPLHLSIQRDAQFSVLVYGSGDKIFNCLYYLQEHLAQRHSIEVMVLWDGNPPPADLITIGGVQLLYSPHPLGELAAWNYLAKKARGRYIIFLDDRCQVTENYLDRLIPFLDRGCGVGGKIISEHSQLLSAGVVMAEQLSYFGDQDYPGEPCYNYVRPVEALPPMGFAISTNLFWRLEGLREEFSSAAYGMADFCYRLSQQKIPVIYQPKSQLIYRDGRLPQGNDRQLWQSLWGAPLPPFHSRKAIKNPTILVVDTLVPAHDRESGAFRLHQILLILLRQGYSVIFLPDYGHEQEPYTSELESLGIEVLYFTYQHYDWAERLQQRLNYIDLAWVCRPELVEKYSPILKQNPRIKLIYDTIDLHFLRLKREASLQNSNSSAWQTMQKREIECANKADITLVVTPTEQQILQDLTKAKIKVIPNIHPLFRGEIPSLESRSGLLFIGGYYHSPNVDAVLWLVEAIMPLIWQNLPQVTLTLLGSNPPEAVQNLAQDPRITVPGYVPDVSPYFLNHRLFVAPLRYGAGMKGKIGHSLSFGLPVVTTPIGAEGIGLTHNQNVVIAESPEEFAQAVLALYDQPDRWQYLSQQSHQFIQQYSPEAVAPTIVEMLAEFFPQMEQCQTIMA